MKKKAGQAVPGAKYTRGCSGDSAGGSGEGEGFKQASTVRSAGGPILYV